MIVVPDEMRACEGECRLKMGLSMTTAAYYPPVYDKHGNNLNPDGNVTSGSCECLTCGARWTYATQRGETVFKKDL